MIAVVAVAYGDTEDWPVLPVVVVAEIDTGDSFPPTIVSVRYNNCWVFVMSSEGSPYFVASQFAAAIGEVDETVASIVVTIVEANVLAMIADSNEHLSVYLGK